MSRSTSIVAVLAATALLLGAGTYWLLQRPDDASLDTSIAVAEAMGSDTTGFERADRVRAFSFPEDHGPHPGFKTEWWYFTGNLTAPDGDGGTRRLGYQWTLFRVALTPPDASAPGSVTAPAALSEARADTSVAAGSRAGRRAGSAWATNQFYMGHFAVSDVAAERHYDVERFSRAGAGLAGAQARPWRVWLETWSLESTEADSPFPVRVRAAQGDVAMDLTLTPRKPRVLQGDRGLSQKGPGSGNASYYYSYTRLATEGVMVVEGDTLEVSGTSWLDREWSTSALGPEQVGWDWFSLQLDDGRDLMYYQLRNRDGSPSRFSEGVLVAEDGSKTPLDRTDVRLTVRDRWTTPDGTRTYPVAWRLQVPGEDVDLRIRAAFPDQEMDVSVRYWEGAVTVTGSTPGRGYVELTGYGDTAATPTL
jgi:predicted secreted hydrolase